jgi:gentisate 1,2-dioxygenase
MADQDARAEEFREFLKERRLTAAGMSGRRGAGRQQEAPDYASGHWKWADVHAALLESAQLVTLGPGEMTEMRTVHGAGGPRTPITMSAQILKPGERTRAHRNMKSETRLVREAPAGALFVCDEEAFPMGRGDVIISPTWTYHESYNPASNTEPAIWIDGFDRGYSSIGEEAEALGMNERYPEDAPYQAIEHSDGFTAKTLGRLRYGSRRESDPLPPVHYPWNETVAALNALKEAELEGDPFDALHLMFQSPLDGGPTLPTMAWHVQMLREREKTRAHRHNSTTCYHVFEGAGATVIEGQRVEWGPGDIFVIPAWRWHSHENAHSSDAILFSIDDWPAMTKLGFYRKQEAPI